MKRIDFRDLERRHLWERDYRAAPAWQRRGVHVVRTLALLVRDFSSGDLNLRAMSLVYTTLLSLVPFLAMSFSILKGFGVQNRLDETLRAALAPLGADKASEITENIIGFVNNMNVGVLGALGLAFLIFTVVSLMGKIEDSFNHVWRVRTSRSIGDRFTTFLSTITVGPLLVFAAIALTGSAMNTSLMAEVRSIFLIGQVVDLLVGLLPFAFVIGAFTFLYTFIPNTRVSLSAALTGAVVAGILWETMSFGFAAYASGASNYQLVYATFATAILFMVWLYLNWLILLIGASIAFYRQHPEIVATGLRDVHFSADLTDTYALAVLARIGRRFYDTGDSYALDELSQSFETPSHAMAKCLDMLTGVGLLTVTDDEACTYVPGVPFDDTTVTDALRRVARYQPDGTYAPPPIDDPSVAAVLNLDDESRARALDGLTLKDLALDDVRIAPRSSAETRVRAT